MEPIPEEVVERHIGAARQYCINTDCASHVTEDRYGCGKWGLVGPVHPCETFVPYRRSFEETKELPVAETVGYIPDVAERKLLKVEVLKRHATVSSWIDTGVDKIPKYNVTLQVRCQDGTTHVANEKSVVYGLEAAKLKLLTGLVASLEWAKREDKLKVVKLMFPDALKEVE